MGLSEQTTARRFQSFARPDAALQPPVYQSLRAEHESEDDDGSGSAGTAIVSKPKSQTKTPRMYQVIIMNDDYTPMDFVIHVLQKFFNKSTEDATQIMLAVHRNGMGLCGVFSYEIAETKVYQVNQYARQNRHPLKCIMEQA